MEESSSTKDNVKVVLRVRPFSERENNVAANKCCEVVDSTSIVLDAKPEPKTFNYDFIADENVSQEEVYHKTAQPIVDSCLEGYNGTIFAYGQTGSGKTYTIQGPGFDDVTLDQQVDEDRGILPRAFEYIFNKLDQLAEEETEQSKVEYLVRTSYLEIYNEQIMDLLNPTSSQNLQIREDIKKGVYVEGLIEEVSNSARDMLDIIKKGAMKRHTGSTLMNKESSRSHSVLSTTIESKIMKNGLFNIKISKFHIIDLAGSERAKNTEAAGTRLKEAGMINKSLSALGNVINSLVDVSQGKSRHVHYRDSKLTFLLRDSLGGNSKTLMIANISAASNSFGETLSTLKFAQRAKLIKNKAIINEDSSGTVAILKDEIKRLKLAMTKMKLTHSKTKDLCRNCNDKSKGKSTRPTSGNLSSGDENNEELQLFKTDSVIQKESIEKKQIDQLERLLKKNLNQLTQMQGYYDREISEKDLLLKRYKCSCDNYEKQHARDSMIIKFRDSTISKLGGLKDKLPDEEMKEEVLHLEQQIRILHDQLSENPQLVNAHAEKEEMKYELAKLKKDSNSSEESFFSLYKSNLEFLEELKEYIAFNEEERQERNSSSVQEYIKKIDAMSSEIQQIECQTEGYKELLSSTSAEYESKIIELEEELDKVKREIREQKEKEIFELKERLICEEQAKRDIHTKHQNLYEEKVNLNAEKESLFAERESLYSEKNTLQTEKINIEKLYEQMKKQYTEKEDQYESVIAKLKSEISEYKQRVDSMKNTIELQNEKIKFLEGIKTTKEKLEVEKKSMKAEIEKLTADIRKQENEIMSKSEHISDLSNQLTDAKAKITTLEEEIDTNESQYKYSISELETKVRNMHLDHENTKSELKKTTKHLESEQDRIESLNKQFENENMKSMDTVNKLIDEKEALDKKNSELLDEISNLKIEVNDLNDRIKDMNDDRENIEIDMEMKTTQIKELEAEYLEISKDRSDFKDKYIDTLNKTQENEREIEELKSQVSKLNSANRSHEEEINALTDETMKLKMAYQEATEILTRSRDNEAKYKMECNSINREMTSQLEKVRELERKIREQDLEIDTLRDNVSEEQRLKDLALQDVEERDKQLNVDPQVELGRILKHEFTKKLAATCKQLQADRKELSMRVEDLEEQLRKMELYGSFENQESLKSKIKHFQKIKDENNFLKKELVSMFNENRRLKQSKGEDDSKSKSIKLMEMQCRKMQAKIDSKNKELLKLSHNANKMCDYIFSRPSVTKEDFPSEFNPDKLKRAIEAIASMNQKLVAKDKEVQELSRTNNTLDFNYKVVEQEKQFLKQQLDLLIKGGSKSDKSEKSEKDNQENAKTDN